MTFNDILVKIDDVVWGIPTIVLILFTGLLLTIRCRGIQFTKLGRAFKQIFKKNEGEGELSGFSALCTALSATIGTGNIVGVATAIAAGGPGALFWMWFAAILGTATKYAECMLAIKYREVKEDGTVLGGPFYTIEKGMGKKWKWLAVLFAVFGVAAGLLGIGTMTQINGITSAVNMAISSDVAFTLAGNEYTWATVIGGAIVTICAALVIIGGLKRISKVAEKIVPAMAIIYVFLGLSVLIMNATKIPAAFVLIFKSAFGWKAVAGGAAGWVLKQVMDSMQKGIARGIFSNEAGLGSAPIAHAAADVNHPVKQGIYGVFEVFMDTIVVCTMTALVVLLGVGVQNIEYGNDIGANLTIMGFESVFGTGVPAVAVAVCLSLFALSTVLTWALYGTRCVEYLFGHQASKVYQIIFCLFACIAGTVELNLAWAIADTLNGLMAIPNLIALALLSPTVIKLSKEYFSKIKAAK